MGLARESDEEKGDKKEDKKPKDDDKKVKDEEKKPVDIDFDGIESAPRELNDVSDMPLITKALLERGYSTTDIKKILGGNFIRVFKANSQ